MTIIVFLIDTSASMNQRTYLGARTTLLDVAKSAVETFIKFRKRDAASTGDRYMLVTFEEPPSNIKAGWKENQQTFSNELKNLQAHGLSTLGSALKHAFDILNINRMQTGIDTYGQGRCPFYLEPSIIIVITDGGKLTSPAGAHADLNLPMHSPIPGSELTREPFRWDQRLFSLVLRLTGAPPTERDPQSLVPSDCSPIDAMCEVTGGRSFAVTSHRTLMQCLESIVQKLQGGVVINFEKTGPDPIPLANEGSKSGMDTPPVLSNNGVPELDNPVFNVEEVAMTSSFSDDNNKENTEEFDEKLNQKVDLPGNISRPLTPILNNNQNNTAWHSCRKMIFVQRSAQKGYSVGHWPIPEAFWPDINSPSLPPRTAQPILKFTCTSNEPLVIENMPFDKYELEPSPLTQYILSRKQPNICWQVFVPNSCKNNDLGHPFGYLKASTNLACVNLFVMPYNYPVLLPLLDELFKVHRLKPTREWRNSFDNYLKSMPLYYAVSLKRAFQRIGVPNLVPDNSENCLSYSVLNYLKRLKNQAKAEHEKLIMSVGTGKPISPESIKVTSSGGEKISNPHRKLADLIRSSNPAFMEQFKSFNNDLNDFNGFKIMTKDPDIHPQSYRNPFDISKNGLLDQIARMRANYLQTCISNSKLVDNDQLHNQPVGQMGNYQEYLKRIPQPLREIDSTPLRQHMFGNPFKIDKRMMVDEADLGVMDNIMSGTSPGLERRGSKRNSDTPPGSPRPSKRKVGPLPRDFVLKRPNTPPVSPKHEDLVVEETSDEKEDLSESNSDGLLIDEYPLNIPELLISNGETNFQDIKSDDDLPPPVLELNHNDTPSSLKHISNHISDDPDIHPPDLTASNGNIYNAVIENDIDCEQYHEENTKLKTLLFKEVRRYGKNYDMLFKHLEKIQGSVETRKNFVTLIAKEAMRFKRKTLVYLLNEFGKKIKPSNSLRKPTYGSPTSPSR